MPGHNKSTRKVTDAWLDNIKSWTGTGLTLEEVELGRPSAVENAAKSRIEPEDR